MLTHLDFLENQDQSVHRDSESWDGGRTDRVASDMQDIQREIDDTVHGIAVFIRTSSCACSIAGLEAVHCHDTSE